MKTEDILLPNNIYKQCGKCKNIKFYKLGKKLADFSYVRPMYNERLHVEGDFWKSNAYAFKIEQEYIWNDIKLYDAVGARLRSDIWRGLFEFGTA